MSHELVRIEYGLDRLLLQDPDQNQLDVWAVALQIGLLDDQAETGVGWQPIARAVLYGIDIDRCLRVGESPFEVADAHSADVAYYYEHVLDVSGEFQPDVEEEFAWPPSRALFLHENVDRGLRRKGYASLLVADAILTLAPQGTAVFAHPGPTDLDATDENSVPARTTQYASAWRPRTPASWHRLASGRCGTGCGCWIWRWGMPPRPLARSVVEPDMRRGHSGDERPGMARDRPGFCRDPQPRNRRSEDDAG